MTKNVLKLMKDIKTYLRYAPNFKQWKSKEIMQLHYCKTTENKRLKENIKATKNKEHIGFKGATVRLTADFSIKMMKVNCQ